MHLLQPILCFGGFANDEIQINVNQLFLQHHTHVLLDFMLEPQHILYHMKVLIKHATQLNLNTFNPNVSYLLDLLILLY